MHPIDHYITIQRGLEELRRQAEQERLIRAAKIRKLGNLVSGKANLRRFCNRLGIQLLKRSQKLWHFGTSRKTLDSFPASPHH